MIRRRLITIIIKTIIIIINNNNTTIITIIFTMKAIIIIIKIITTIKIIIIIIIKIIMYGHPSCNWFSLYDGLTRPCPYNLCSHYLCDTQWQANLENSCVFHHIGLVVERVAKNAVFTIWYIGRVSLQLGASAM